MSEPSAPASAAQIIARRLRALGCRHAFGIPGGEVLTLIDALREAGIAFHLAKHENAAGFMAEGAYHATGAPGVLVATLGPGAANAANVVANAHQDRVPLIVLTGCADADMAAAYTHQLFDHRALFAPITKASLAVVDGAVETIVDKALAIAREGQPGPVHLDLPIRVAAAVQPPRPDTRLNRRRPLPAPAAPAPGPEIDAARALLADTRRPLMVAGLDVIDQGASETVAAFARDFAIPLITTYKAKGVLDENHPLALGGAGLSPKADACLKPLLERAELVVLAGYDPIEMRAGWIEPFGAEAAIVEFAAVAQDHAMHHAQVRFVGHVGKGIEALREGVSPTAATWPGGEPAQARAALAAAFPGDEDWGPAAIVDVARRVLPPETVASVDTGAHRILLSQMWRCPAPRTLLQSTGLCTMGCALPLAIGHALARPETPMVAFTGDAGLEMVLGELATARDLGAGIAIVVFVDASLALIEAKQRAGRLPNTGVDFGATDFAAVAEAMGGCGVVAADRDTLAEALREALARDRFTLITCPIGRRAYDGRF